MSVSTWEYTDSEGEGTRFIGPMDEEFDDAFDVGDNEKAINADGAAFAAIKGLAGKFEEAREAIDTKDERIDDLADETTALHEENEQLRERNDALESRLATVESRLGIDETVSADD